MRALVISDIHANLEALEACIAAAPAYDAVWNLGDLVGYGANPNEVVARSRDLGNVFVRGNHDKACSGLCSLEGFNPVAALAVLWTQKALTPANLAWLRALPRGPIKPDESLNVACVHGAPKDEDQYLIHSLDAAQPLLDPIAGCTFFGHTHIQGGFATDGNEVLSVRPGYDLLDLPERLLLELSQDTVYLVNPGSIGQPRDGDPRAAFALLDTDNSQVTFYRVPYDIEAAQQKILDAGLPERLATRLADGR